MKTNPVGRKLRISTLNPGSPVSRETTIHDADTGEFIDGISRIVITLDIKKGLNEAEITYFDVTDSGGALKTGDTVLYKTTKVENVEIDDITAFEIMDNIRSGPNPWQ